VGKQFSHTESKHAGEVIGKQDRSSSYKKYISDSIYVIISSMLLLNNLFIVDQWHRPGYVSD
jgi:hypothetical protein